MLPSEEQPPDRWIERARQSSRSAMNSLMAWCRPRLIRQAEEGLAHKEDASDVVQECQLRGAEKFDEFRGQTPPEFLAWMRGILNHLIQHQHRFWTRKKRDRKREQPLMATGAWPNEPAGSMTSILGRLAREEEWEQLMVAAGWCRVEDQYVISLHLFEGRSHEEIAAELGISSAAVRQQFCRALRSVRKALKLLKLMTRGGIDALRQEIIGLYRFQKADPATIANRLQLTPDFVARWLAEAEPLIRKLAEANP